MRTAFIVTMKELEEVETRLLEQASRLYSMDENFRFAAAASPFALCLVVYKTGLNWDLSGRIYMNCNDLASEWGEFWSFRVWRRSLAESQ